jgi:hypothetical protein
LTTSFIGSKVPTIKLLGTTMISFPVFIISERIDFAWHQISNTPSSVNRNSGSSQRKMVLNFYPRPLYFQKKKGEKGDAGCTSKTTV